MATFHGFVITDTMPHSSESLLRLPLLGHEVREIASHGIVLKGDPPNNPVIDAVCARFGFHVVASEVTSNCMLEDGDTLICVTPRGLPKLIGRSVYTTDEIARAEFAFSLYVVKSFQLERIDVEGEFEPGEDRNDFDWPDDDVDFDAYVP